MNAKLSYNRNGLKAMADGEDACWAGEVKLFGYGIQMFGIEHEFQNLRNLSGTFQVRSRTVKGVHG